MWTWVVGRGTAFCEEFDASGSRKGLSGVCGQHKATDLYELASFEENELWKPFGSAVFVTEDKLGL